MRGPCLVVISDFLLSFACGREDPTTIDENDFVVDESAIDRPLDGETASLAKTGQQPVHALKVPTWNVFVGTDPDRIMGAPDPAMIPALVEEGWQDMMRADFHERAAVIAEKIARTRPHLVGLQEITLLRAQSPGDAVFGGTTPATDVVIDYLQVLLDSTADLGLDHRVASIVENWDVELPRANATFDDARVTDYDVVLVQDSIVTDGAFAKTYDVILEVPFGGGLSIPIKRGFCAVDVSLGQQSLRFVTTHFETQNIPPIQYAQAAELVAYLSTETRPVVVVGDMNSEGDGSTTSRRGSSTCPPRRSIPSTTG